MNDTAQVVDEDFDRYAAEMLKSIDAIFLEPRTLRLFADYWPSATGPDADRLNELPKNELPKIVFSRTLEKVEWKNSRLFKDSVAEEVALHANGQAWEAGGVSRTGSLLGVRRLISCYRRSAVC